MASGYQLLQDMDARVNSARAQVETSARELARVNGEFERAQIDESQKTRGLAQTRLALLDSGEIPDSVLDADDRQVLQHLQARRAAQAQTSTSIAQSRERQQALEQQRNALVSARDDAAERAETAFDETQARMAADPAWQALSARAGELETQAARAASKAEQALTDRVAKGKPYESDKLFSYLWARKYGTSEYRAGSLARALDGWVAGLVAFETARRDYWMLTEIPGRLAQHAERMRQDLDAARVQLTALEKEALERDGFAALDQALLAAQEALDACEREQATEEARHAELLQREEALAAGTDEHSEAALKQLAAVMARTGVDELQREAGVTADTRDDLQVVDVAAVRQQVQTIRRRRDELDAQHKRLLAALYEVEELRRDFRKHGYDSRDSEFPGGFDLGGLLDGILRGSTRRDNVWDQIRSRRIQRRSSSSSSSSGGFGGGWSSGSSRSSSSSSSSRSGGGFRSGGSFGGGGGFKTGGGF